MKQPVTIETKGGKMIAVQVPLESKHYKGYNSPANDVEVGLAFGKDPIVMDGFVLIPGLIQYKILGEISHANGEYAFSFNPGKFVDKVAWVDKQDPSTCLYRNYKYDVPQPVSMTCGTSKQSLISLLQLHGLTFVNECGEKPEYFETPNYDIHSTTWEDLMHEWLEAEEKRVSGNLVILKCE